MSSSTFHLFSGPCVLESEELVRTVATFLKEEIVPLSPRLKVHFKGSFDKANRSSIDSYRGPGMEKGLELLKMVKSEFELPTITDFHFPDQADPVAQVVDVLQVPAFLCRQTDMIVAGARACQKFGKKLKVKKGQFLSPQEMDNVLNKAAPYLDLKDIFFTERGSSFGYNNLIVDMYSFTVFNQMGVHSIHDATHCVQRPGGLGKSTGGLREAIAPLAKAAVAAGASGIFLECHPNPSEAKSDASTCMPLQQVAPLLKDLLKINEVLS